MKIRLKMTLFAAPLLSINLWAASEDASFLWLEEVEGQKALEWVGQQNAISQKELEAYSEFSILEQQNLAVYQSQDRIPYVTRRGDYYYNFWQDKEHVRGIYRRTSLAEYRKASPTWETVIDFDQLAESENENWVYKGMNCLYPKRILCLVNLSRGGADATVVREFNMLSKSFVKDGFYLPEAKSSVSWIDENTLFVGTEFGSGTMTDSGYPRVVKRWKRGMPLTEAEFVMEGRQDAVGTFASRSYSSDGYLDMVVEVPTFFSNIVHILKEGKWQTLAKPDSAEISGYFNKQLFMQLKEDWQRGEHLYPSGAIIYDDLDKIIAAKADYKILLTSNAGKTLSSIAFTQSSILVNWLEDVKSVLERYTLRADGSYKIEQVDLPKNGEISVVDVNEDSDDFMVTYTNFLQPDSLYIVSGKDLNAHKIKQLPAFFEASIYETKQYFATSKDGTKVPYFVVMAKNTQLNGKNPTLLYGYGGFEVSLEPSYSATIGIDWLSKGGIFVLGNIRGGGEYGPAWHQAALKENRHKAFEDFESIAEDLIKRKITSPKHLGIRGGSNGGLLMGAMLTRRPELFNAVVCQVPLLDMLRFNKLLAGASWMGEYGNPDITEERAYLASYSPYHNISKTTHYPRALFTTSTRDDRVHPGHARKMVAKMKSMGHDVLYYENTEGGHSGAVNQKQSAYEYALIYTYLLHQLR